MVKNLVTVFPTSIRPQMQKINWDGLEEIRVRIGWPVELIYDNRNEWLGSYDCMIDRHRLDEMLNYITGYSVYAMDEELRQGYITYSGGHRIGITGHATYEAFEKTGPKQVTNIVDIGGLNIRIAHERKGCAEKIIPYIKHDDTIYNTIIFSSPGIGKTTYLRDAIRILAEEKKVCVVDERSEIAACIDGKPQNNLGKRCDVLDACPKLIGMRMVLRSMSPEIIAVDELGKEDEFQMLEQMRYSGVKILGTMHAGNIKEIMRNPLMKSCIESGAVERFVELDKMVNGKRYFRIYDEQGTKICKTW